MKSFQTLTTFLNLVSRIFSMKNNQSNNFVKVEFGRINKFEAQPNQCYANALEVMRLDMKRFSYVLGYLHFKIYIPDNKKQCYADKNWVSPVEHAWNYDVCTKKYFDTTPLDRACCDIKYEVVNTLTAEDIINIIKNKYPHDFEEMINGNKKWDVITISDLEYLK